MMGTATTLALFSLIHAHTLNVQHFLLYRNACILRLLEIQQLRRQLANGELLDEDLLDEELSEEDLLDEELSDEELHENNMSKPNPPNTMETQSPSARRVLADVSPNVKLASPTPAFLQKAMVGSPLKRSFTAAIESGEGFTYLKKRRLGEHEVLSEVGKVNSRAVSEDVVTEVPAEAIVPDLQETTPTEPNTPSEDDSDTQGSSAERKSFSSLINYDPSSQTSNLVFKTVPDAELLRLRLRLAMFKVRTNQVDVPFSDLKVGSPSPQSATRTAVEEAVAQLRREAMEVAARQARPSAPALQPAPLLQPTAFSSRMIKYSTDLPSSPPASLSPDKLPMALAAGTPLRDGRNTSTPLSNTKRLQPPFEELTSSAVKGRVAEGLLGLRHAV